MGEGGGCGGGGGAGWSRWGSRGGGEVVALSRPVGRGGLREAF